MRSLQHPIVVTPGCPCPTAVLSTRRASVASAFESRTFSLREALGRRRVVVGEIFEARKRCSWRVVDLLREFTGSSHHPAQVY